jgi:hypothetical protein
MGHDFVNTTKRKTEMLYGREKVKILNPIAYQVNTSEMCRMN